jgi:predicted nuclease of predicted toxin-antitoxin system
MKFLIDECLSPELAELAQKRGYPDSAHVVYRGIGGIKDWDLVPFVLKEDWTLVTRNSLRLSRAARRPRNQGRI